MWIFFSILFPALTGVVNIFDKIIVDRYHGIYFYAFWIGIFELGLGLVGLGIAIGFQPVEGGSILGGMLVGALGALSLAFFLAAVKLGQVARVVPIWFLYPLMVAPMAVVFLDESLSPVIVGAIILAVVGAILVSWQKADDGGLFGNPAVPPLTLLAAGLLAMSFVMAKWALENGEFWQFFGAYRIGFAPVMLAVGMIPRTRGSAPGMIRNRGFISLMVLVEGLVTLAVLARFGDNEGINEHAGHTHGVGRGGAISNFLHLRNHQAAVVARGLRDGQHFTDKALTLHRQISGAIGARCPNEADVDGKGAVM